MSANTIGKNENIKLRPYQLDIVSQCNKASGNTLIMAPTGAGKTVMAKEIAAREINTGGKVLIVAPKTNLMDQTTEAFRELSPAVIHGSKQYDRECNLFVSTIQTAHKRDLGFTPTMIIIDEVHYGFSGKMIKSLLGEFSGRLVGLSATPYDKDGNIIKGFEEIIDDYDLKYLIAEEYLVPPVCYRPVTVDLKDIRTSKGDYDINDLDKKFNTIESVNQVVSATKAVILNREQTIVFCINIKHSEVMAEMYQGAGIVTKAIHSKLSAAERENILKEFKAGKIQVLTNPDMLTTGFDHPPVDTIVLARATRSQNLYKQIVGRALRRHPKKENAVVLDCAGVINDLGLPLDPIRPKKDNATEPTETKKCCSSCESTSVYRRVMADKAYWRCGECGNEEEIKSRHAYECDACHIVYGDEAVFKAQDEALYLICSCGHKTIVSVSSSDEELEPLFDEILVEVVVTRVTKQYISWLIETRGPTFITEHDAVRQIAAVQQHIKLYPNKINSFDPTRKLYDGWRIIPQRSEENYQPKSVNDFEKEFLDAGDLSKAIKALNDLMNARGMKPLSQETISELFQQLSTCQTLGIESKTVTRLKNIYKKGEKIANIITFIPYISGVDKHSA